MKHGILLVHGIGDQTPEWAEQIISRFKTEIAAEAAKLVGSGSAPNADAMVAVGRAYWADVLQGPQRDLVKILEARQQPVRVDGPWWIRLKKRLTSVLRKIETKFAIEFVGDVIGYLGRSAHGLVHARIAEALDELRTAAGPEAGQAPRRAILAAEVSCDQQDRKAPLTIISHSLGTVICSDYLYDHATTRRAQGQQGFHANWRLENFFTIGSPMALFSLRYGGPEAFLSPVRVEGARGRWVNIFDKDDPVGMPLKALNDAYNQAVLQDAEVDSGDYLIAHTGYFDNPKTLAIISRKIALDWAAVAGALPAGEAEKQYAAYDRTLGEA